MAGWSFTITRQPPEEYAGPLDRDAVLATWTMGAGGTRWNDRLVKQGEAESVRHGGYPIYIVPARGIAPLLAGGDPPLDDFVRMFRQRELRIKHDELECCAPDQALMIAVWNHS